MNKHQMMMQIRGKKLALLIRDARLAVKRELAECAQVMGVEAEVYKQFEAGEISPSLPQLESLASFLNVPMDHFWGKTSKSKAGIWELEKVSERISRQNQRIAETIKQNRENAGLPLDEMEEQTGIDAHELGTKESGEHAFSLPQLETLCSLLEIDLPTLYAQEGITGAWHAQKQAAEIMDALPEDLQAFISKPVNQPYIQLAQKLSEMPAEKLRTIAESLLEITL